MLIGTPAENNYSTLKRSLNTEFGNYSVKGCRRCFCCFHYVHWHRAFTLFCFRQARLTLFIFPFTLYSITSFAIPPLPPNPPPFTKKNQKKKKKKKAYVSSGTKSQKESLLNVKSGFKECTQTMCAIEHSLENMIGTFHLSMKGIQGYSR